jgi:hypothetical protein
LTKQGEIKGRISTFFDPVEGIDLTEVSNRRLRIFRVSCLGLYLASFLKAREVNNNAKIN